MDCLLFRFLKSSCVLKNPLIVIASIAKQARKPGSTPAGHEGKGKISHTPAGHESLGIYNGHAAGSGPR